MSKLILAIIFLTIVGCADKQDLCNKYVKTADGKVYVIKEGLTYGLHEISKERIKELNDVANFTGKGE